MIEFGKCLAVPVIVAVLVKFVFLSLINFTIFGRVSRNNLHLDI